MIKFTEEANVKYVYIIVRNDLPTLTDQAYHAIKVGMMAARAYKDIDNNTPVVFLEFTEKEMWNKALFTLKELNIDYQMIFDRGVAKKSHGFGYTCIATEPVAWIKDFEQYRYWNSGEHKKETAAKEKSTTKAAS